MNMKSKWTKWQVGFVIAGILFYLFQEVKLSPEFLAAVTTASASKQKVSSSIPKEMAGTPSGDSLGQSVNGNMGRRGESRQQLNNSGSSSLQIQPHTRSHAS